MRLTVPPPDKVRRVVVGVRGVGFQRESTQQFSIRLPLPKPPA